MVKLLQAGTLEDDHQGCLEMWRRVIVQAVEEAKGTGFIADEARGWIFESHNEKDFFQVCEYAGVDPEAVRDQVTENGRREEAL
jgi:hypothetical protein